MSSLNFVRVHSKANGSIDLPHEKLIRSITDILLVLCTTLLNLEPPILRLIPDGIEKPPVHIPKKDSTLLPVPGPQVETVVPLPG